MKIFLCRGFVYMCWILIYSILKAAYALKDSQHNGTASAVYNSDYRVICCSTMFDSLVSVPCGQKCVGILSVILY